MVTQIFQVEQTQSVVGEVVIYFDNFSVQRFLFQSQHPWSPVTDVSRIKLLRVEARLSKMLPVLERAQLVPLSREELPRPGKPLLKPHERR
jgi:hypothetical protein